MYSLLVVDDEPGVQALVARLAEAAGCTVSTAGCAGEALDRMAECPASVVLCDLNMPDRSGLWLATQLRQQFPDTALVLMSGGSEPEPEIGLENSAIVWLSKPFSRESLLSVLERARERHLDAQVAALWAARVVPQLPGPLGHRAD